MAGHRSGGGRHHRRLACQEGDRQGCTRSSNWRERHVIRHLIASSGQCHDAPHSRVEPVALLLKGLSGVPLVVLIIVLDTLLVQCTEDRSRGRVVAAYGVLTGLALVSGQILASVLGDPVGVVPVLSLQGILYTSAGFVALACIPRSFGWCLGPIPRDGTAASPAGADKQ